jgi:ABC-type multidrug transport system ATPase subunit
LVDRSPSPPAAIGRIRRPPAPRRVASPTSRADNPRLANELADPAMADALRIAGLSKTYPNGVQALVDVTLDVPTGMFGLLGPNGAGKSTLMRTLATLQDADAGSAHLGAIDVLRDKDAVRRMLGYLPQDFGVYPKVSAEDMLDHLARLKGIGARGVRRDVVEGLLRQVNLWDVRRKALGGYSGGMRQRFGIAQALIGNPRLVIVDEPTAGLDPEERVRFHNLLAEIGENVIVILSTHIVSDVSDLCASMAIIDRGRVRLAGRPETLTNAMVGRVWQRAIPRTDLEAMRASLPVISTRLVAGRTLVNVVADASPGVGFVPVEATLEDVYFAAIGGRLDPVAEAA